MEQRVLALVLAAFIDIVVAEHRIELDAIFQKAGVWLLEFTAEVPAAAVGVNIVACGNDEIEWSTLVRCKHLACDPELLLVAGAPVSDDGEPYLVIHIRTEDGGRLD
jgi:hypothetical protein